MPARKGSNTSSGAGSPSPPGGSRGGRMAQRRGSSAEAAVQAEVARLGHPNGVLKRGFLVKKGHVMPTRKERYFVLGQQSLSYYRPTKEGDVKLKGVLELKASDVISPMPHSDVWLRIRQNEGPGGKSYKLDLKASNQQARREWIESLRKACRGELLLRQRTLQSDVRLLHARASQRDRNVKAMAEFLSSPMSSDDASTPQADLRASFQILHEMLLLKKLVDTIKNAWGEPSQWSMAQYQELVQGICLAQEKSGSSDFEPDSILAEAFKLRYQFEEIPENQRKLSRDDDPLGAVTSGSGKTELAKDLLKYLVLVAEPALSCDSKSMPASSRQPKIKLFTSSTKSTVQMRTEEARTIALLEAKGVESYEIVLLDLYPERWDEMTKVSRSKRLPQVHVDGLFFGFYDKLEHLEDEEQLRMYFKNPQAAKKLSTSTGETFEVTLEKGQVNHVRDTLARLLYQLAFEYIVAAMNEATKMDAVTAREDYSAGSDTMAPHGVSSLKIVDVFGFEDLTHNSLDQLCINYLSEKLYAREEQVVLAAYCIQPSKILLDKDKDVLRIYEHPLGVFASLEELTILHQSENDTEQQEEKRNKLFVRNIYERNHSRLPEPPRVLNSGKRQSSVSLTMVPFVIPYTRGSVVYDARDFVKKNSDFAYANLLTGLNASNNSHIRQMLKDSKALENGSNKNNSALSSTEVRVSASKSFVGQFRSHVNALTSDDDTNMPFYFHCIRPNEKKQPSVVSKDLVLQQCRSQRLIRQLEICSDPSTAYSAIGISKDIVLARYGSLVRAPYVLDEMASNEEELLKWLSDLLRNDDNPTPKISLSASSIVEFGKISLVEKLELFLEDREAEAAAKIQSLFRMITWRYRYLSKNRERRGLSNELLAWYGPQKKDTVTKLLTKYNGRENELRSKLELKKKSKLREQRAVHQLSSDLQSLCLGNRGGLDAQAVNDILHDDKMRELLQQNEKIVLALRDMSLNPTILESQLADHELRAFYQTLVDFLRSKRKEATTGQGGFPSNDVRPEGSLGDRVLAAASEGNRALWMRLVEHDEWAAYHDALVEVGEDPEMLLFHSEDDDFVDNLERFLKTLVLEKQREEEQRALAAITNLVQPSTVDEEEAMDLRASAVVDDEDAEMLELLLGVKFGPSLMVAMNADSYFVRGLQDPVLMTSLHQLMANPKDFAISTALQQPAVREFFLKLIALSFAVQEQSDEE
ncbi:hypothetical protein PRNP1_011652 [Phytophthora ramorum]